MKESRSWFQIGFQAIKFILTVLLAVVVYKALFEKILTKQVHLIIYILFWLFSSYIVLPWLNRLLSKLYVPQYFIGRSRTGDGLLGDPINLAFYARETDLIQAFEESGWHQADRLSVVSSIKIVGASIFGKSYPKAPVSSLFLFSEQQTLAFEKEIDNNPRKRHHIRLWKTPENWHLPGGKEADWLAAATLDRNVGLSLFTGQITHKIDGNIDHERDFVLDSLKQSPLLGDVEVIEHFTTSYHSRNGGGDRIETDGALPFITIKQSDHTGK